MSASNPPARDRLDDLLDLWAEASRLNEADAGALLTTIVRTPVPGLDPTWWEGLAGRLHGVVLQAAVMPEAAQAAVRQALVASVPLASGGAG